MTGFEQQSEQKPKATTEKFLAALDIGSNSFHFVYARLKSDNLQILHTEKYRVILAEGLSDDNVLSDEAITRGIVTLSNFLSTTENLTSDNFRVVATYTLRQAKNCQAFLRAAKKDFPFDIEVISGEEEARLIYQGVAHTLEPKQRQLVIDIGGGSTEFVIGEKFHVKTLASLNMGCVSYQKRFFSEGLISDNTFNEAILAAKCELEPIVKRFKSKGWQQVIGTSGTIKAIYKMANIDETINKPINIKQLHALKNKITKAKHTKKLKIKGLKGNRRDVICSGLSILIAAMEMLDAVDINYCPYSLGEGVLYQQLDILKCVDIRQRTINSLAKRFSVDHNQADNVAQLAIRLLAGLNSDDSLNAKTYQNLLRWAGQIHELGIDINPAKHFKHGGYILSHAHLSGFNQEQQQALSWLVGNQRQKISSPKALSWHILDAELILTLGIVLRLSVLLNQQRQLSELSHCKLGFTDGKYQLFCDKQWLLDRPIVDVELFQEQQYLAILGVNLAITS